MNFNILAKDYSLPLFVTLGVFVGIILLYILIKVLKPKVRYFKKEKLVSDSEMEYFKVMYKYFGDKYIILPQVNLAAVIDKEGESFRTELFRNADFGFFTFDYEPVILVEINDRTHFRKDRVERDKKVKKICKKAKLPLVTFWTKDGVDEQKIYQELKKYL